MQLNQAMLCLIKSDMKQRMLFFFFPLKASKTPEKLPRIKFILELFGIKLPQCYASFDSLTLMRAEWLNLYVLHRNLGSWEMHVSNPWKPSTACISIALLALIQQGNGGTQELIKVMPQRRMWWRSPCAAAAKAVHRNSQSCSPVTMLDQWLPRWKQVQEWNVYTIQNYHKFHRIQDRGCSRSHL